MNWPRALVPTLILASVAILVCAARPAAGLAAAPQEVSSGRVLPPAADVAALLQQKYDRIKDFSASFTQTYQGGVLRRKAVESGTVYIKKPGKMRWEYTKPQQKLFVSDGKTMFMYFPDDKQVMTYPVPEQADAASAVLFLMGRGHVTRDFAVRYADRNATSDDYVLRLDPKTRQAEYEWLEVGIDRDTLQIRALTAADSQGGRSTFTFSNLKENVGLADKLFQFSIPRGTEVIRGRSI